MISFNSMESFSSPGESWHLMVWCSTDGVSAICIIYIYIHIHTHTEWTRRNATTTPMVERPPHAIGTARLPPKCDRDLRQNKFK